MRPRLHFALLLTVFVQFFTNVVIAQPSTASSIFADGTACQVTVSSTANLTYSHDVANRTCSIRFLFNSSTRSITLPSGLYETTITLQGARGGQGGERGTTRASTNSYVGVFSGVIPNSSGITIDISTGARGLDGSDPVRNGTAKVGPTGGVNPLGYANGGIGGGILGAFVSGQNSNGTGGSGGAATIAVIDGQALFAGGGGGTGGSGRKNGNGGIDSHAGGAARSNSSSTLSADSNGETGGTISGLVTADAAFTWVGGGGGGGGGYLGGSGGSLGILTRFDGTSSSSTGGYPGQNGTDFPLESSSSSYLLNPTTVTTTDADGSVVIVFIYKASTATTVTFTATTLEFRTPSSIIATTSVAGRVSFKANSKYIPGCRRMRTNVANSYSVTCIYKPSSHSQLQITIYFDPGPAYYESSVITGKFHVVKRTNRR